ncbi:hypothetical protein KGF57_000172 [Candida theae]|uniref:Uncharacterized protein n=1 Tax=Candida theae TaxID=1198502 RepID=A0AAD5G1B8_9ASCO|nr:uncharacterized protein KGF57_000172 [Candida theae]KAI5968478.1 hypothetical protein KGF57_000172 [Candida theae]
MSAPSTKPDLSNQVSHYETEADDQAEDELSQRQQYHTVAFPSPQIPIRSKSTSNLPALSILDTKPISVEDAEITSSVTTPIHPLHSHHNHNLIDLGQEEIHIAHHALSSSAAAAAAAVHHPPPRSLHSLPPLPIQHQHSYSPIGRVVFRYLEQWILGLIERHRNGPYFYPIAISVGIVVAIVVFVLVVTGNLHVLVSILRHLICELVQSVSPSPTIQFCV